MAKYIMAFDAGTTSNRCILFDRQGNICSSAQKEFTQIFPRPGWVEHDAREIWATQLGVAVEAMGKIGASAAGIAAIAGFAIQSMFDYTFYNYRVMLLFWGFLGIYLLFTKLREEDAA